MDNLSSWIYLLVTTCVFTLLFGSSDCFGILLVIFVEYFNETNSKIGWVGSIKAFSGCGVYPFVVFLHRRLGFPTVVVAAAFICSSCYIATPFVPNANYLFLSYSIPLGLSVGFLDCISIITIPENFKKHRGLATGVRFAMVSMGAITFNFLMPIFIDAAGWKKTFFCLSSMGGIFLIYTLCYHVAVSKKKLQPRPLVDEKKKATNEISGKRRFLDSHGFLRDKKFWLVLIASIPFVFVIMVPAMFVVQYAKTLGYPLPEAKWLAVVHSVANVIGRGVGGWVGGILSRRWKVSYMVQVAIIFFGISSGLGSFTQSLLLLKLYIGFNGCLEGIYWVNLPLMMQETISGEDADYAYSLMMFVVATGLLSGPPTMGWLFNVTGDFRNVLYAVAMCATISGLGMVLSNVVSPSSTGSQRTQIENKANILKALSPSYSKLRENSQIIEYETTV